MGKGKPFVTRYKIENKPNGLAFPAGMVRVPVQQVGVTEEGVKVLRETQKEIFVGGMWMDEYYAAAALQGLLASSDGNPDAKWPQPARVAELAFGYADAMVEQMGKRMEQAEKEEGA